jgi:hypothetical protein
VTQEKEEFIGKMCKLEKGGFSRRLAGSKHGFFVRRKEVAIPGLDLCPVSTPYARGYDDLGLSLFEEVREPIHSFRCQIYHEALPCAHGRISDHEACVWFFVSEGKVPCLSPRIPTSSRNPPFFQLSCIDTRIGPKKWTLGFSPYSFLAFCASSDLQGSFCFVLVLYFEKCLRPLLGVHGSSYFSMVSRWIRDRWQALHWIVDTLEKLMELFKFNEKRLNVS